MVRPRRITIRNKSAEANLFARRTFITFIGVIAMVLILFSNIYNLEINSFDKYQTRSNSNRIKLLPVAPNRGLIFDRNGVILADNKAIYSLEIIPEDVEDIKKTVTDVSILLGISADRQNKFFTRIRGNRRFKPIELKSRLSDQQVALFSVNQHKFPGVFIDARLKRYYPFGELTTHNIGYVARINQRDLQKLARDDKSENYAATREIGKLGIEKYYENILHGEIGHQKVEINNQGRVIRTLEFTPPTPGKDLTLNLDIELQMVAKRALSGKRGAIVVLDPRDGGVLAMYSNPSYDGNLFVHGISSKNYKKLLSSKDLPLINRSIQGYPPASTVKPIYALLGLEEGIITPESKIHDPGFYKLKGIKRKFRDWWPAGHGWVNLTKAIEKSCNIYFYDLSFKLGITKMSNMLAKFGFGEDTGIDIHEESRTILPSVAWKRARYNESWYTGETLMVGIGQSFLTATPLQLAQATSILVNKGRIKVPHLLKETSQTELIAVDTPDKFKKKITREQMPIDEKPPIILKNEKYWDFVLDAMHKTAQKYRATAYTPFKGSKYDVAGKTGSAQVVSIKQNEKYDATKTKENQRDNAMFISFAPYEKPEIVVVVAIENVAKGGGGSNAGPVARQIMDQYFGDRVIESTDPSRHPNHDTPYLQKNRR